MNTPKDHNPIEYFQKWFHEVDLAYPEEETNAMLLSTIGIDGFLKSRVVLLKRFTWEGFIFFTDYNSEKGKAIAQNNRVSISFHWTSAKREVFVKGYAEKIAKNLSEGYFESRPEGSKLSAWVSQQSKIVPSRKVLEDRLKHYENKFKNKVIPKPENWGGYLIKPNTIEFMEHDPVLGFGKSVLYCLQKGYTWSQKVSYIIE